MVVKRATPVVFGLGLVLAAAFPFSSLTAHAHWDRVGWLPFLSPPVRLGDVIGNMLLGVPAALSLTAKYGAKPSLVGGVVATLSLLCEVAQVYSHGRYPSATDFVCNVSGAMAASAWWGFRHRRLSACDQTRSR